MDHLDHFLFFHYQSINFTSESFLMVFQMREFEYGLLWLNYLVFCCWFLICQPFCEFCSFLICQSPFVTSFLQRSQFIVSWESLIANVFFKDPIAVCQSKFIPITVCQSEHHLNEWPKSVFEKWFIWTIFYFFIINQSILPASRF